MGSFKKTDRLSLNMKWDLANKMAFHIKPFYISKFSLPRIIQPTTQDINYVSVFLLK